MPAVIPKRKFGIIKFLADYDERHPYVFAFIISMIIVSYMFFSTPSLEVSEENMISSENITFIDMDTIQAPKRVVKKDVSATEGDVSEDTSNVERATGTSDDADAVDISFYPNVAPPKPIGRLKKYYPEAAKENNIEAKVIIELLISASGKVKNVNILGVRLSKQLPPELYSKISKLFAKDARRILLGARFTPPIVNGKQVPIKMEMPLNFRLE